MGLELEIREASTPSRGVVDVFDFSVLMYFLKVNYKLDYNVDCDQDKIITQIMKLDNKLHNKFII